MGTALFWGVMSYLPRAYGNIFIWAVYIPPSGNAAKAALSIADCAHQQLRNKPDTPLFVLGDFNHCKMEHALPGFQCSQDHPPPIQIIAPSS